MRHHLAGRKQGSFACYTRGSSIWLKHFSLALVWNARVNEAPWFRSPKPSSDDRLTRLPPPISARTRHRRNFSSPVAFFTRKHKDTDADPEKPALRRQDSASSRSITTEESGGNGPAIAGAAYTGEGQRGTGFVHARARSEPIPAMFGSAATRANVTATRPPLAPTPAKFQSQRRPSESRPSPPAALARSGGGTGIEKPTPPTPALSRNTSASKTKTSLGRSGSASAPRGATGTSTTAAAVAAGSRNGPKAATPPTTKPFLDRRPTTTRPPVVYVPTPASTHAWQRSPLTSSDAVGSTPGVMPPIAARMMESRERDRGRPPTAGAGGGQGHGRSGSRGKKSTSRDRGPNPRPR